MSRKRIGGTRSLQKGSSAQVTIRIRKRKLSNGGVHQVLETLCPNTEENLASSCNRCQPQVMSRAQDGARRDSELARAHRIHERARDQSGAINKLITWICGACVLPNGPSTYAVTSSRVRCARTQDLSSNFTRSCVCVWELLEEDSEVGEVSFRWICDCSG